MLNHPLLPPLVEVEGNQPLPAGVHQGGLGTLLLVIMLGMAECNWCVCGRGGLYLVSGGWISTSEVGTATHTLSSLVEHRVLLGS